VSRGFALVEVIVAITIFFFGILGVSGMAIHAANVLTSAQRLESAVSVTERVSDSLLAFGLLRDGVQETRWGRVEWTGDSIGGIRVVAGAEGRDLVVVTLRRWDVDP
jgi:hypothetical protein